MPTATLPAAYSVDLTKRVCANSLAEWIVTLLKDGGNKVYWSTRSGYVDGVRTVRQEGGRALTVSLAPAGNEGYHLTVSAFLAYGLDDPRWLPLVTAKVFSVEDGVAVIGKLLTATADWFVW